MLKRGLYLVTDPGLGSDLLPAVAAALQGGAVLVQYRDKSSDQHRRQTEASALLALCRQYNVPLLINDDVALALAVGADGVHLGRGDGSLQQARATLGPNAILGATCHDSLAFAEEAVLAGANYIAFGAFYPSASKPHARPAPLQVLQAARQQFACPIVAIGGITVENAPALLAAGADLLAVIGDLCQRPVSQIAARAAQYSTLFESLP